ncbi:MAG: D-2-hydroxyacid dehydrogenase [Firmicutes bacterium]|uniref:D-2-hydroxyacid dehydrogenase n=1 Tax=Sulfobacillus benefaciens TaxID=453960 RepID=A0A2T2X9D6_9FIRM|nr:D-2-hydroxyacid dehydrogenase [Bacillota bacterium]PSR31089.1 MAG: D-2-hydroxyacid dehydrogenase [Sulfobacillus benefaciens]
MAERLRVMNCPGDIIAPHNVKELEVVIPAAEIIFGWRIPPHLYAQASHLKWVQSMGAGVDDLVSNPHLSPSVVVTRIVGQFGPAIAEFVFSELLAHVRHIDRLRQQQNEHRWQPFPVESLEGRHFGIAGLGSIGRDLVRKAKAFDMTVLGLSRTPRRNVVDHWFSASQWQEFVGTLDYLVVTLPSTPETRHVVDSQVFSHMKSDAIVVNVGRGDVINQEHLTAALLMHQIRGAVLDVFETEPLPADDILWELPNVRVSPHIAGPSLDEKTAQFFLNNVRKYLDHKPLVGLVNREQHY